MSGLPIHLNILQSFETQPLRPKYILQYVAVALRNISVFPGWPSPHGGLPDLANAFTLDLIYVGLSSEGLGLSNDVFHSRRFDDNATNLMFVIQSLFYQMPRCVPTAPWLLLAFPPIRWLTFVLRELLRVQLLGVQVCSADDWVMSLMTLLDIIRSSPCESCEMTRYQGHILVRRCRSRKRI